MIGRTELCLAAVGALLVRVRERRRYSQRALAAEAGVAERTIGRIEQGRRVDLDSYDRVGDVLGLPTTWFLYPDDRSSPSPGVESAAEAASRSLFWARESGLLGGEGLRFLERFFEFAQETGGPDGRLEGLAARYRRDLDPTLPIETRPVRR